MDHNLDIRKNIFSDRRYADRLDLIQKQVKLLWTKHIGPEWNIFHDHRHNIKVEGALFSIVKREDPPSLYIPLSELEWFQLLAAAWLHDIGMIVGLFRGERKLVKSKNERDLSTFYHKIRQTHHLRAKQYIEENYETIGIDQSDLPAISSLCRWHRINAKLPEDEDSKSQIRVKLLAAFLKLALIIHLDEQVILSSRYQNPLQVSGMDWENQFHWFKNSWVKEIEADPDKMKITFHYYEAPKNHPLYGFIYERIKDQIEEIVHSVLEVLVRGRNSCFLDVDGLVADNLPEKNLYELELIRSSTRLEELSSAREAYDTVLKTIVRFSNYSEPYQMIVSYIENIQHLLTIRPSHNLIRNLIDEIIPILNLEAHEDQKVRKIRVIVENISNSLQEKDKGLSENAKVFLKDQGNILLFGYSVSVLNTLKFLPGEFKQNTQIFICECRGKTQFDADNRILYDDGLAFAKKVAELGYRHVQVIPDIATGNLMKRNLIQKVFFGANDIDIDTGSFGHTCGHLAIADQAKEYGIPVYVIADTAKFGELQWDETLNCNINLLTNDPE